MSRSAGSGRMRWVGAGLAAHLGCACTRDDDPPVERLPDVLVVVLDDIGVEQLSAYGTWPGQAHTPTLDRLAAEGVRFRNAYANPECSPSRAALVTGRYGRRTGIGLVIELDDPFWLEGRERGLPEVLADRGYTSSLAGKWHLGAGPDVLLHPASMGFDWFAGSVENLGTSLGLVPAPGWYAWEKNVRGTLREVHTYATTDTTDDAVAQIRTQPEPWLTWVAYNAAHAPYEAPPPALVSTPLAPDASERDVYHAMLEALDTELGRLLDALSPEVRGRTTVIVVGDNGTPAGLAPDGFDPARSKDTVFEGGIRVPLLVSGPDVAEPGSVCDALVHAVDVFATVVELAGATPEAPIDGISFRPLLSDPGAPGARTVVWSEKFEPNGHAPDVRSARSIRDARYKLVRTRSVGSEVVGLYRPDPEARDEGPDLLADGVSGEESRVVGELSAALDAELASLGGRW